MLSISNSTAAAVEIPVSLDSAGLPYNAFVRVVTCLLSTLILWRTWRFTILPLLHPDYPKELPYWIPCKLPELRQSC